MHKYSLHLILGFPTPLERLKFLRGFEENLKLARADESAKPSLCMDKRTVMRQFNILEGFIIAKT